MSWINRSSVKGDASSMVTKMKGVITKQGMRSTGERTLAVSITDTVDPNQKLDNFIRQNIAAGVALQREWFCDSVGMVYPDGEQVTIYISRAPIESTFAEHGVRHWTHWLGRLPILIRDYLDTLGKYPDRLQYGPPDRPALVGEKAVGPWVQYRFCDGVLTEFVYRDSKGETGEEAQSQPTAISDVVAVPAFGLKDIVNLRDLSQDEQIHGPMSGVYVLTGGPGVGKTSVALHRIPYLLFQQREVLRAEVPDAPADFFHTESMQVVVWKQHLVPYLQKSLQELHVGDVAVRHVEDWVAKLVREYVPLGRRPDEYRISADEPDTLRGVKLGTADSTGGRWTGFTETMLGTFLNNRDASSHFHNPRAERVEATIADLRAELDDLFAGQPLRPRFDVSPHAGPGTIAGVEARIRSMRAALDRVTDEVNDTLVRLRDPKANERREKGTRASDSREFERVRPVLRRARERTAAVRDRLLEVVTADYAALLAQFFRSDVARGAVSRAFDPTTAERFVADAGRRIDNHRLSVADCYLLLWLIHQVTRNAAAEKPRAKPLPSWSHTVIDEAQYYHPLILRLIIALARPPLGSVTIVGDLEQKVSADGGLIGWEEAGIHTDRNRVFRLNTNYRWSEAVFGFLDRYRRLAGLGELKAPRRWASGAGLTPEVVACSDEEGESVWLVDRVSRLRQGEGVNWSVAVVVPPSRGEVWCRQMIDGLTECGIPARWATGEDVRESGEKVVLTDYHSVVGLEFDAVLLPGCDDVLSAPTPTKDGVQAAWVALTRARQFVAVSHVRFVGLFDNSTFDSYRVAGG